MLTEILVVKAVVFLVVMYRCGSWSINKPEHRIDAFKLWCWRKLDSPLDHEEIKPVYPKGDEPWILVGRTVTEAEVTILWPPDAKSQLI